MILTAVLQNYSIFSLQLLVLTTVVVYLVPRIPGIRQAFFSRPFTLFLYVMNSVALSSGRAPARPRPGLPWSSSPRTPRLERPARWTPRFSKLTSPTSPTMYWCSKASQRTYGPRSIWQPSNSRGWPYKREAAWR